MLASDAAGDADRLATDGPGGWLLLGVARWSMSSIVPHLEVSRDEGGPKARLCVGCAQLSML